MFLKKNAKISDLIGFSVMYLKLIRKMDWKFLPSASNLGGEIKKILAVLSKYTKPEFWVSKSDLSTHH